MTNNNNKIDSEILAVISAAIASMSSKLGRKLVISTIKRVPQNPPVWNAIGRIERIARNLNA